MPHAYMGVNFPIPALEKPAPIARQKIGEAVHFWPPDGLPFAYTLACVDMALLYSPEAKTFYDRAVGALLRLPGCQPMIYNFYNFLPNVPSLSTQMIIEGRGGVSKMHFLKMFRELYNKYSKDADCLEYFRNVSQFVLLGFNRREDRHNRRYKITPEVRKSGYLLASIFVKTIAEACGIRLSAWEKYRTNDFDRIMTGGDPTTRQERKQVRIKRGETRQIFKSMKWIFRHDSKLLKYADQWYKCRVSPGTIEAYLDELAKGGKYLERSNIETGIAPIDEAMGYPRKWRK